MKKIILSYLVPYAMVVGASLLLWLSIAWVYDGWGPWLAFAVFIVMVVFSIPYMLYNDYQSIKRVVVNGYDAYNDETKRDAFYTEMVITATSVAGIPEFIAEWGVTRAMSKIKELKA